MHGTSGCAKQRTQSIIGPISCCRPCVMGPFHRQRPRVPLLWAIWPGFCRECHYRPISAKFCALPAPADADPEIAYGVACADAMADAFQSVLTFDRLAFTDKHPIANLKPAPFSGDMLLAMPLSKCAHVMGPTIQSDYYLDRYARRTDRLKWTPLPVHGPLKVRASTAFPAIIAVGGTNPMGYAYSQTVPRPPFLEAGR